MWVCGGGGHQLLTCVTNRNDEDNREQRKVGGITMRNCRRNKTKVNSNMKHAAVCGKLIKYTHNKTHRSEDCPTVCSSVAADRHRHCHFLPSSTRAGLVLRDFLCDFALKRLENWHHFPNLHDHFGLTRLGTGGQWLHLSRVGGLHKVTSLSRQQSRVWIHYISAIRGDVWFPLLQHRHWVRSVQRDLWNCTVCVARLVQCCRRERNQTQWMWVLWQHK